MQQQVTVEDDIEQQLQLEDVKKSKICQRVIVRLKQGSVRPVRRPTLCAWSTGQ